MELVALYKSDSEDEPLAGPFNLFELPEDLPNGILCMLSGRSSHQTAGGPRKLVLGMACAMGNSWGAFISPFFPSLGLHRNLH